VIWALRDTIAMTERNLRLYLRIPALLVFSTVQPAIFVLLFRYVFGGAIHIPGVDYPTYLMAGIFAQTAMFGAISTGVGLATDKNNGFLVRLRSLPMSRGAVLAGRTLADAVRNVVVVIILVLIGLAVGFRPASFDGLLAAVGVMLLFSFAFSWVFALLALSMPDPETTQTAAFPIVFPLVFASAAFVPTRTMPHWLASFAEHQPVSMTIVAVRSLFLGGDIPAASRAFALGSTDSTLTLVGYSVAWSVALIAVFGTLSVRRYRRG
jgi:ABC-2 type transport system permease protein